MKQLDIRFMKENDKKRQEYQLKVIAKLQEVLPRKIAEKFDDIHIRIRFSSTAGVDVTGIKNKDEKERLMEYLEELWNDSSLVELD
ncbi:MULTISPECIES: DinI-like family protein [Avibacterium]|uniref:DinI family protein n=1 Tax=Avibacterium endocarditidis TaxID=380674 RepID=A0ABX4ZQC3_9PAST|nr:DinI-like family protein [Avibacterium endocarditidis]POY41686.1 DinI family protein [Avibacterium endocarditidis]